MFCFWSSLDLLSGGMCHLEVHLVDLGSAVVYAAYCSAHRNAAASIHAMFTIVVDMWKGPMVIIRRMHGGISSAARLGLVLL